MEKGGLTRSACLIAVVGAAAIAIIGFSTWRYDVALSRAAVALNERADATTTAALTAAFWHERQAIGLYIAAPKPAVLRAVTAQHDHFQRLAVQLGEVSPGADARSRAQAVAANEHYYSVFTQVSGAAGTTAVREGVAANRLAAAARSVIKRPSAFRGGTTADAAASSRPSATCSRAAVVPAVPLTWVKTE